MRYLLDTNICIYRIIKRPLEVLECFRQHSPKDIGISTITLFELQYGIEKSRYRQQSEDALAKLHPLRMQPATRLISPSCQHQTSSLPKKYSQLTNC